MFATKYPDAADHLADNASQAAQDAIKSTQGMVNNALNSVADVAVPMVNRASDQASALVQRGADALRDGSQLVRNSARQASDSTVGYIRDEPVKAMLIAAATGAALMGLVSLMGRSRNRD